MPNKVEVKVKISQVPKHLWVEPHVEITSLSPNGYIKNVLRFAGLLDFVTEKPKHFLLKVVLEFFLNMNKNNATTAITYPLTS